MSILDIRRGFQEGTPAAGAVFTEPYEGPYEGPLFLGGPQRGQYYNKTGGLTAITGPDGAIPRPGMPITTIQSPDTKPGFTSQPIPSLIQDYLNSSFSKRPTMGHMALVPITLPTGETYTLRSGGDASNFRDFLGSLNMTSENINNIFERRSETPPQLTIPTPVPSPTMPTPTVPTPTMPTPTVPEPNIPGFQSFSGSGREGIMNLLASRFRDLNLGMMNRLRNNPGSFYSRSPLDQTSSMPSGLQNLFFRSGNNLNEIPNSMNMMRRAVQSPSYTNTGIATSFTPNFVPLEIRRRRR